MDVIGTFILVVIMALATMGGIGGGGVVVLLIQRLLYFSLKESIALSGFSIFTCAVTRYIITKDARHPEKKANVALDYGLASVMMPAVLMGSFIGVWFNIMLPEMAIQVILALLLFFLTFQAGTKAMEVYRKENKAAKAKKMTATGDQSISKKTKPSLKKLTTNGSIKMGLANGLKMRGDQSIKRNNAF
jgi:competence protein ComGC